METAELERLLADPLPVGFYSRHTLTVARDLLGKILAVRTDAGLTAGRIVETEAYRKGDPAAHAYKGETPRASTMFGAPGVAYVYFIYGVYEMLNFVTEPAGEPGAVLIRAVEPLYGEELMHRQRRRGRVTGAKPLRRVDLTNGPGKLCRSMGILMGHNRQSLRGPGLFVCDDGYSVPLRSVLRSPRVGITQGTELPWRYFLEGCPFVSRAPQNAQAVPDRQNRSNPRQKGEA